MASQRQLVLLAVAGLCLLALVRHQVRRWRDAAPDSGQLEDKAPDVEAAMASVCWKLDCLAELLLALPVDDAVPPVRHLLLPSDGRLEPEEMAGLVAWRRLHPTWTLCLWTEVSMQQAVNKYFRKHSSVFNAAASFEEKSRAFRFLLLQKYGGMFLSTRAKLSGSAEPLRRLGAVFASQQAAGQRPRISGDFMMAVPGHPAVQFCSDRLLHWGSRADAGYATTQMLAQYATNFPKAKRPNLVVLVAHPSGGAESELLTVAGRVCQQSAACTDPEGFQRRLESAAAFGVVQLPRSSSSKGASVDVIELLRRPQLRIVLASGQHIDDSLAAYRH